MNDEVNPPPGDEGSTDDDPQPTEPVSSGGLDNVLHGMRDLTRPDGEAAPPPVELAALYDLQRKVGSGGQGSAWLVIKRSTGRPLALKLQHPEASPERFLLERQLLARLLHRAIPKVVDAGTAGGRHYYTMDFVPGPRLDEHVRQGEAKPPAEAVRLLVRLCEAVQYLHDQGIFHRDLKPSNVVVDQDGDPKIIDFGLAKVAGGGWPPDHITSPGRFLGTPAYASPEQASGDHENVGARSDLYSLGVILYRLLTGQFPYKVSNDWEETRKAILEIPPRPPRELRPGLSPALEEAILRALEKSPDGRHQSAAAFKRALEATPEVASRPSPPTPPPPAGPVRRRGRVLVVGLGVAGVLAMLGYLKWRVPAIGPSPAPTVGRSPTLTFPVGYQGEAPNPNDPPMESLVARAAEVHIALRHGFNNPLPWGTGNETNVIVSELIFDSLFRRGFDYALQPNEAVVEGIDEDWPTLQVVVRLKEGLKWQDGRPLTADDIVFSWRRSLEPKESDRARWADLVEDAKQSGDRRVRFTFKEKTALWMLSLSMRLVPAHCFETRTNPEIIAVDKLVGGGPMRLVQVDDEASTVALEPWEDYPGPRPGFARLVIHHGVGESEGFISFLDGNLDLCTLTYEHMKEGGVHGEPFWRRGGRYVRRSSDTCVYIVWNCENPFLADPSVRGAMKSAMNIERIIQTVTGNLADPCAGLFAPYLSGDRPAIQPPGHHPAEAGQRLDEAGWHPGEEGVRWKELAAGGREAARFDLLVPKDSEALCRAADIISDELGRIGVSAEVRRLDKNRLDQHLDRGEFGAYLTGTRVPIDPGDWRPYFTSTGDRNHGKYFNRQVDALFDQAAEFGGWRQKTDTYRQIQEILQQDQPVTYLYWKPAMYAMSRRLRQVAVSPRGPFLHYPGVLNWWVAKESPAASGPASRGAGSNSP